MRKIILLMLAVLFAGCSSTQNDIQDKNEFVTKDVHIKLSDEQIVISDENRVMLSQDIIYYEAGHDTTYGEGNVSDAHTKEEADLHTVITIREPGTYHVSGSLSNGQIAIDLGENAKKDENAVVNLILEGVDLTCTVAPAMIVYNAYECASKTKDNPDVHVNLSKAGFNLILEKENTISGAYVAEIYKTGTVDTLHKYDAAIESLVSFNIKGNGSLNLKAANEGIETKMHMHIQSGNINILSADDSLNASEDGVSVIRISSGTVVCNANLGTEGDGIDSNGWIVIEGGLVSSTGNSKSMDSGLDSDNGILIHGGTVAASGNMLDEISSDSKQNILILQSANLHEKETLLMVKQQNAVTVFKTEANASFQIISSENFVEGSAELWQLESAVGNWSGNVMNKVDTVVENGQYIVAAGKYFGDMDRPGNMPRPEAEVNKEESFKDDFKFEGEFDPNEMEDFDPNQMEKPEDDFDFGKMPLNRGEYPSQSQEFGQMQITEGKEFTISNGLNQLIVMGIE